MKTAHQPGLTLGRIVSVDLDLVRPWRELRARGLREHPEAFGEPVESFQATSDQRLLERIEAQAKLGGFVLAAVSKSGAMMGTVGLHVEGPGKSSHRGHLWGMYVTPESRGQKVGQRLVEELLARAAQVSGLEQVHLAVVTSNASAIALYTGTGFTTYGTDPSVLKVGGVAFDEFLMVRLLRPSR